jgi:hypothetical protein
MANKKVPIKRVSPREIRVPVRVMDLGQLSSERCGYARRLNRGGGAILCQADGVCMRKTRLSGLSIDFCGDYFDKEFYDKLFAGAERIYRQARGETR